MAHHSLHSLEKLLTEAGQAELFLCQAFAIPAHFLREVGVSQKLLHALSPSDRSAFTALNEESGYSVGYGLHGSSTVGCYHRNSRVHRLAGNYSEMLVIRSIQHSHRVGE